MGGPGRKALESRPMTRRPTRAASSAASRIVPLALLLGATLGATLGAAPAARAWSPEMRVRMADEAVRFMPASLRLVLESRRDVLLRAMLEPLTRPDRAPLLPPWTGGTLDRSISGEAQALIDGLRQGGSFDDAIAGFGRLALYTEEAGFPPGMGDDVPEERRRHFTGFCDSRLPRFPLVFYGHAQPDLDRGDFLGFARATMQRSREEDAHLARAYAKAGSPPDPSHFDDRSVPFAVASLAYSRTVTDIVRVWLAAWRAAGGDLGRTPYLARPSAASE